MPLPRQRNVRIVAARSKGSEPELARTRSGRAADSAGSQDRSPQCVLMVVGGVIGCLCFLSIGAFLLCHVLRANVEPRERAGPGDGRSSAGTGTRDGPGHGNGELDEAMFLRVVSESTHADRHLHQASAVGDAHGVRAALLSGANVCSLSAISGRRGQTAMLTALSQRQQTLATQSDNLPGDYEAIVKEIALRPEFRQCSAYQCPMYFALHYRNTVALQAILSSTPSQALFICLLQRDAQNMTVFHHAVASRASGFARLFMRQLLQRRASAPQSKGESRQAEGEVNVLRLLNLSLTPIVVSHLSEVSVLTHEALTAAVGHQDVALLAERVRQLPGNALATMLEARDSWEQTTLHIAAAAGRTDLIRFLLPRMGPCSVHHRNIFGQTPRDLATIGGFPQLPEILLDQESTVQHECSIDHNEFVQVAEREDDNTFNQTIHQGSSYSQAGVDTSWNGEDQCRKPSSETRSKKGNPCAFSVLRSAVDFTQDLFKDICIRQRRPLLIKGLLSNWTSLQYWLKTAFLERFGADAVAVNTVPYGNQYGHHHSVPSMKLRDYAATVIQESDREHASREHSSSAEKEDRPYVFDGTILHRNSKMWKMVELPFAFSQFPVVLRQLILGPVDSGSPPHFHGIAVNFLLAGRKRWLLAPPASAHFYGSTAKDWFRAYDSSGGSTILPSVDRNAYSECIQEAGDAMVVPDSWGHAVINLRNSVAVAVELAAVAVDT